MHAGALFTGGIDFKRSPGAADDFDSLLVRESQEIVSLGIAPHALSHHDGGKHVEPAGVPYHRRRNPAAALRACVPCPVSRVPRPVRYVCVCGGGR
jgi:hypothetical protein